MSSVMTAIVGFSLVALLLLSAVWARSSGSWRRFAAEAGGILLFAGLLHFLFGFPLPASGTAAKGPSGGQDLVFAAALGICMVLGMAAQFLYQHFEQPARKRKRFDWGLFVAPIFASPVVYVPLLASFQNADIDLNRLTIPRLMIFLVAFQNGFFWKEHFDRRRKEAESGTE
ncbi:MAG: hypothetical protein HY236_15230 [Acidobacteria bacterium]|nr:hypothetical protein [Acidobacteriota bacterium]